MLPVEPYGHSDALVQTDGIPKVHLQTDWTSNKNFAFPDELELQSILGRLSHHTLDKQGDTDSLSSYTSGLPFQMHFSNSFSSNVYLCCLLSLTCSVCISFQVCSRILCHTRSPGCHSVTLILLHLSWLIVSCILYLVIVSSVNRNCLIVVFRR